MAGIKRGKASAFQASVFALFSILSGGFGRAEAAGSVVVYCGMNEEWCRAASTAFQQKTSIQVSMTRQSSGEIYARLKAEKDNSRGDIARCV